MCCAFNWGLIHNHLTYHLAKPFVLDAALVQLECLSRQGAAPLVRAATCAAFVMALARRWAALQNAHVRSPPARPHQLSPCALELKLESTTQLKPPRGPRSGLLQVTVACSRGGRLSHRRTRRARSDARPVPAQWWDHPFLTRHAIPRSRYLGARRDVAVPSVAKPPVPLTARRSRRSTRPRCAARRARRRTRRARRAGPR